MKKGIAVVAVTLTLAVNGLSAQTMSLAQALDACVKEAGQRLPTQTRIACPRINADSPELAEYTTNQLNLRLVRDSRFIVVDRDTLSNKAVDSEIDYQLQGNVSDETAVSITQKLGATAVITGSLSSAGRNYRLDIRVVLVETSQIVLQWSAEVQAGGEWNKFTIVNAGLWFESSDSLSESEKKILLQGIQRGLQKNQTPLSLPSAISEAEELAKDRCFMVQLDYEEKNGLTVGAASIAFVRNGVEICVSKEHYITEMGFRRFMQKVGEALGNDTAFFKQLNEQLSTQGRS